MKKLLEEYGGTAKRTYKIEGNASDMEVLDQFLATLSYCAMQGASRQLKLFVDGDGASYVKVTDGIPDGVEPADVEQDEISFGME